MRIAYIVYIDKDPAAFVDTEHDLLMQFLRGKGLDIYKEEWSDENVDWKNYQCIVLKSPWDYVFKPPVFYQWLQKMQDLNIPMLNPAQVVRWNSDKHYLQEIAAAGLNVIPTAFLEQGTNFAAESHFQQFNTSAIIVKPCISGASKNTFKLSAENAAFSVINELLQKQAMMVQPFMPQINDAGEWSLVFLGGRFSHALLKTPASNDFRSQAKFGGVVQGKTPSQVLLNAASQYVSRFAKGCLYARVDGLIIDGQFHLMELELIDPYLFLSTYAGGYENYYNGLSGLLV